MFFGRSAIRRGHRVQKERPRSKIETGVPVMPMGSNLGGHSRSANGTGGPRSLPDNGAGRGVQRIHIIRFGHRNHYWAVWPPLDVKWLRKNGATIVPSKFKSRVRFAAADCVKAESI